MRFFVVNEVSERREGLKTLLRQIDRQATFAEARSLRQIELALARAEPDLLLFDCAGTDAAAELSHFVKRRPPLAIAALTADAPAAVVIDLLRAGVLGVIPRDLEPALILRALELVVLGGYYVPALALDLPPSPLGPARARHTPRPEEGYRRRRGRPSAMLLSPRQRQILDMVHMGSTNKVIARALGISEGTVKIHLASAFKLLGATNRAGAVAIYNGWQYAQQPRFLEAAEALPTAGMRGPIALRRAISGEWPLPWTGPWCAAIPDVFDPHRIGPPGAMYLRPIGSRSERETVLPDTTDEASETSAVIELGDAAQSPGSSRSKVRKKPRDPKAS
ncbi:MAG: LuxR C-terminal-related transcriptional regulator [Janthinobacterium lividum]